MNVIKLLEPVSPSLLQRHIENIGLDSNHYLDYVHPQEDYVLVSNDGVIATVADGVTLELGPDNIYPHPSGASEAAKIFCKMAVKKARERYADLTLDDLSIIFRAGNEAVGEYNRRQGRIKGKINYDDIDLFAATGALLIYKGNKAYWLSICDSRFCHLDKDGRIKFISADNWDYYVDRRPLPADWDTFTSDNQKKYVRKYFRNGLNDQNEPIGYGVITGEAAAEKYINYGIREINQGDLLTIFTDGFENYFKLPEFINLLITTAPQDLGNKIKEFTRIKAAENLEQFGHERSLVIFL